MVTTHKLMDAASRLVAEEGFGGLRVDQVARRAGVNKRLIYVHFGDRDGLTRAVFANALWSLAQRPALAPGLARLAVSVLQAFEQTDTRLPLLVRYVVDDDAKIALLGLMQHNWSGYLDQMEGLTSDRGWPQSAAQWLVAAIPQLAAGTDPGDDPVSEDTLTSQTLSEKPRYRISSTSARR